MKIQYFGKIKRKYWEEDDLIVVKKKEKHYYYQVEYDKDDIYISDTCGRFIPIDKVHLTELINALATIEANLE